MNHKNKIQMHLGGLTVLYAEDEQETRDELKKFLLRRVGKVITSVDGKDALEKIEQSKPDIVIADLIMPKIDGVKMIQILREKHPQCQIIITTTVSEMQTILDVIDVGIVKYIIKPIVLTDMDDALMKCAEELWQRNPMDNYIDPEERKHLASQIKKDFSNLIKLNAGKGPRDVAVFMRETQVEIVIYDGFTKLEHSLSTNNENFFLIEQTRRAFYRLLSKDFSEILNHILGEHYSMNVENINPKKFTDKLIFQRVTP